MATGFLGRASLKAKLIAGMVIVLLIVMIAVIAMVEYQQRVAIIEEARTRGMLLARNLASVSTNALMLYNYTALEQYATKLGWEQDVLYAVILDKEGGIAAYSGRPEYATSVPRRPEEPATRVPGPRVRDIVLAETREPAFDIEVPVIVEGTSERWGTIRVGLSKRRMLLQIQETRWKLVGLALVAILLGVGVSTYMAGLIGRPVKELVHGVEAVARGDLEPRITIRSRDELGTLAHAFNEMATQLGQQRAALVQAHGELRQKFHELGELNRYTDNMLASMTDGLVTLDLEGRVVTWNAMAEQLTGLAAAEIQGQSASDVLRGSKEFCQLLLDTLAQQRPFAYVPLPFHRPDGQSLPMELSTSPLKGAEGQDLGVVGIFRDMTVQRELEAQLRRADRLAALGTLAAGVAHEIKNPLVFVRTHTQMFQKKHADEEFRAKFVEMVPRELDRINEIVEGLLELARPATLNFALTRVHPLLDRVLGFHASQLQAEGIIVERGFDPSVDSLWADGEHLYRVLVNLVLNAIQAMNRGGGTLTVSTRHVAPGNPLRGPKTRQQPVLEEYVAIDIADTGPGIPDDIAEKLFTPFFTTKKNKGTGLGLALALKIVEDHGGRITFRSQLGSGTTFTVTLPTRPASLK